MWCENAKFETLAVHFQGLAGYYGVAFPSKAGGFLIQLAIAAHIVKYGWPAFLCWFATQNPLRLPWRLPRLMKTPGLGINPVESFNTLNLQSPVEKSDNLPQVSSTQTSPAAKLILNSAVTRLLQDLEICLGRLPFRGTFPFLVDLQPLCNRTGHVSCRSGLQVVSRRSTSQMLYLIDTIHIELDF